MKAVVLCLAVALAGCTTVTPVSRTFPDAPAVLKERCENLRTIDVTDKVAITEMLKVVVHNYGLYYECSARVDGWNEWYSEQKKNFDNVK